MEKFIKEIKKLGIKPVLMATLLLGLALPVLVLATMPSAINTPQGGYRVNKVSVSPPVFHVGPAGGVYEIGTCVHNKSGSKDYFVPTGTWSDWNHFFNAQDTYLANDLDLLLCCGDGVCSLSVQGEPAETCSTCPQDCGACSGGGDDGGGGGGGGSSGDCWGYYLDGGWIGNCGMYS